MIYEDQKLVFLGPSNTKSNVNYNCYDYIIITHNMINLCQNILDKYHHLKIIVFFNNKFVKSNKSNIKDFDKKYNERLINIILYKKTVKLLKGINKIKFVFYDANTFTKDNPNFNKRPLALIKILYLIKDSKFKLLKITGIDFYKHKGNLSNNYIKGYKNNNDTYSNQFKDTDSMHDLSANKRYLIEFIRQKPIIVDREIEIEILF